MSVGGARILSNENRKLELTVFNSFLFFFNVKVLLGSWGKVTV